MSRKVIQLDAKNEDWLTDKNRRSLSEKRVTLARKKFDQETTQKVVHRSTK